MLGVVAAALVLGSPVHVPNKDSPTHNPTKHGRKMENCAGWCNSYTCGFTSCMSCDVCMVLEDGSYCAAWCNAYTCDQEQCLGCSACDTAATPFSGYEQPPVPGVTPKTGGAHILLGMAPDYPPYTMWTDTTPIDLGGFNKEFADLMEPICGDVKVDMILAAWNTCWTAKPEMMRNNLYFSEISEYVGDNIMSGFVHGCTAYTHTRGERGLSLEFTESILGSLKTAGILTRLVDGKPIVSPTTVDFTGIKVGDVTGWAPTPDTLKFNYNYCVDPPAQFTTSDAIISPPDGNEAAITALKDGTIDALYIYADQISNFIESGADDVTTQGFGTEFAYIQQGLNQWSINGTTLAISKRGSGLKNILDPCIRKVVKTKEYTTLCESYFSPAECITNEFSTPTGGTLPTYDSPMNARTDSKTCADGYCTCSE